MANLTLIYGLRLLPEGEVTGIQDATIKLANGHEAHVTMHTIEGSRDEIETQLQAAAWTPSSISILRSEKRCPGSGSRSEHASARARHAVRGVRK